MTHLGPGASLWQTAKLWESRGCSKAEVAAVPGATLQLIKASDKKYKCCNQQKNRSVTISVFQGVSCFWAINTLFYSDVSPVESLHLSCYHYIPLLSELIVSDNPGESCLSKQHFCFLGGKSIIVFFVKKNKNLEISCWIGFPAFRPMQGWA